MLKQLPFFRRRQKSILNELNDMVRRINQISNLFGDNLINVKQTEAGTTIGLNVNVLKGRLAKNVSATPFPTKIFEVYAPQTGDGVYKCISQALDATEWADTAGDDKLVTDIPPWDSGDTYGDDDIVSYNNAIWQSLQAANLNKVPGSEPAWWEAYTDFTSYDVLNLMENDPESSYTAALVIGDRIKAWRWIDDETNSRWVGVPISGGSPGRLARTTEAATANDHITCNLINNRGIEVISGIGSGIEVYCNISNGSALNAAVRRLKDNNYLCVKNINGKWFADEGFQTSQDCVCTPP